MAPRQRTAGPSNEDPEDGPQDQAPDLVAAYAEIKRLRAQIASQATPTSETANSEGLTSVLQALAQRLTMEGSPATPTKSAKIPDPPILTDGKDPTFENWKIQVTGKLQVNVDHFATEQAQITYVFSRTGSDAQKHLQPRISPTSVDPFETAEDMIQHLANIYEDPFRIQNARRDYRRLTMKNNETFPDFYTRFLHLAGEGHIPDEDLRPDLYDKITLELQRAIAPTEETLTTIQELQRALRRLDQNLRQIKDRSNRIKACTTQGLEPLKENMGTRTNRNSLTPTRLGSRESTPDRTRPSYDDPTIQALSNKGACFSCGQKGHFSKDCPSKNKDKTVAIHQVDAIEEQAQADSEKGQP